ncbi:hypothetical protein IMZ48_32675 [Candidatus Bathyarchaeota archaeon]|nr:hypothetical protein [Candidatus Bathyarchaeota archaeon]
MLRTIDLYLVLSIELGGRNHGQRRCHQVSTQSRAVRVFRTLQRVGCILRNQQTRTANQAAMSCSLQVPTLMMDQLSRTVSGICTSRRPIFNLMLNLSEHAS